MGPLIALGRERVHYEAPPRERLDAEMDEFLTWFNTHDALSPALRASVAHLWFETLHPFEDGNGRLGRAVFDLALAQGATFHSERTSRLWAVSPVILNWVRFKKTPPREAVAPAIASGWTKASQRDSSRS
jgi:hypothetical protein